MLLIQIAIALAICIGLSSGSMVTAQSEMMVLQNARALQLYSQDIPAANLAIQKLVSKAASFNIYSDLNDATQGYPGGNAGLTNAAGTVLRLNFAPSPATPSIYPVGFLCTVSNDGLYYFTETISSGSTNGAGMIDAGALSTLPTTAWKVAGWANNYAVTPTTPSSNAPFNCLFSVSDPFDSIGNASGLVVISVLENTRAVTLYAERF